MIAKKAQHTSLDRVRVLQKTLYLSAKENRKKRYGILYDKVFRMDILIRAWDSVRKNKGSAGIDGVTIEHIEENGVADFLEEIQLELQEETYRPLAIRRTYIPKDLKGKEMRPLGIPIVKDRVIQTAVKLVIEPIFEADFQDFSYGFRPKRSPHDAMQEIRRHIVRGYTNVIDADLKSYFDTIPHDKLLATVKERVTDPKVIRLIRRWLKAGIMEDGDLKPNYDGTQQGGVISPLLANIYLNLLDRNWIKLGYHKKAKLVRFADDYVILTKGSPKIWFHRMKQIIDKLDLVLNKRKTKIVKATNGFIFLGMHFRYKRSKKGNMWCYWWPSQKAMKKIRHKIKHLTSGNYVPPVEVLVMLLNPVIRGWGNYFCKGNSAEHLIKIDQYIRKRLKIWLRRKKGKRGHGNRDYHADFYQRIGLYQLSGRVKHLPF